MTDVCCIDCGRICLSDEACQRNIDQQEAELNEQMHTGDYTKPAQGFFYNPKYHF